MAKDTPKLTHQQLVDAVCRKHSRDVAVTECKDGPSQMRGGHNRLDVWAMPRSWSKPSVSGYECKATRRDFGADGKWTNYLPMCNLFYFACPWGLIGVEETPDPAGLVWVSKNAARCVVKKKAGFRDVEIPERVWRYILMARAKITAPTWIEGDVLVDRSSYWRRWLREEASHKELGHAVARAVGERQTLLATENHRLKRSVERAEDVRRFLRTEFGAEYGEYIPETFTLRRLIAERSDAVPRMVEIGVERVEQAMGDLRRAVDKVREEADGME